MRPPPRRARSNAAPPRISYPRSQRPPRRCDRPDQQRWLHRPCHLPRCTLACGSHAPSWWRRDDGSYYSEPLCVGAHRSDARQRRRFSPNTAPRWSIAYAHRLHQSFEPPSQSSFNNLAAASFDSPRRTRSTPACLPSIRRLKVIRFQNAQLHSRPAALMTHARYRKSSALGTVNDDNDSASFMLTENAALLTRNPAQ